jgi:hypothetical protein
VAKVLPLTYANDALRKVMVLRVGVEGVAFQMVLMVVIDVATIAVGYCFLIEQSGNKRLKYKKLLAVHLYL